MFREISPNTLLKALSIGVVRKVEPEKVVLDEEFALLPIERKKEWNVVGHGDWGRGRSEFGSVVLGDGKNVVKMHLGKIDENRDVMGWAKEKHKATEIFEDVAPRTMVLLVEGVDGPRPAILQKEIIGKPIYKAGLKKEILIPEVLGDLAKIMRLTREGLDKGYALDLSGLRLKTGGILWEKFVKMCPIFSDNIMVDTDKKVWLVDNVPDYFGDKKKSVWFKFKRVAEKTALFSWEKVFLGLRFFVGLKRGGYDKAGSGILLETAEDNKVNI
ncbi:MAG TPA: hypothetical protein VN174_00885 [Candidatus Methanoperedens sp.]|nr:hypothetical protein [Candidatus Methanoperedens sp.]